MLTLVSARSNGGFKQSWFAVDGGTSTPLSGEARAGALSQPLTGAPGTAESFRDVGVDVVPMLLDVEAPTSEDGVIGMVQGWAELVTEEEPRPCEIGKRPIPREGDAKPRDYVTSVYSCLARALRTVGFEGVKVAEGAPVLGIALQDLKEGEDLIWVLVNPQ